MITAQFNGKLKAYASDHPLQTTIELVLTDFQPNSNKQQIPRDEAENIIMTAKNMPLKVFLAGKPRGHAEAYPIGTLTDVWLDGDEIKAKSILWRNEYPKEDEYLRKATAENQHIGTSWEIYYADGVKDNDIEQLRGCVFASTVIVDKPAYGMRTPILSIAEDNPLEELRKFLSYLLDNIWDLEQKEEKLEALANADEAFDMLKGFVTYLKNKEGMHMSMSEAKDGEISALTTELTTIREELDTLKLEKAQAEENRLRQEKLSTRRAQISDPEIEDEFLLDLTEDQFTKLARTYARLQSKAERDILIPEPIGSSTYTTQDLAKALKEANN